MKTQVMPLYKVYYSIIPSKDIYNHLEPDLANGPGHVDELNKKYTFAKTITSRGGGGSDHASFYNKRVPIAFLHTGGHPHYHKPTDTADKINYDGLEKVSRYAFELAWLVCQSEARPAFNHVAFKKMDYVHDHGGVPFMHHYHRDGEKHDNE